jgi:hypothetical protein
MRALKAKDVVQDLSIYPRCNVNKAHVATLVLVLEAGGSLPPIVICRKTQKVIDGFHRLNAVGQFHGWESEIEAVEKDYADTREMWLDSIRYNAKHGLPLTESDRAQCVLKSKNLGVKQCDLALAIGVNESAVELKAIQTKAELRSAAFKKAHTNNPTRTLPGTPGSKTSVAGDRCPGCGARLLQGAECVACQLKDKSRLASAKSEAHRRNAVEQKRREAIGADDGDELPDGWEDRLAELRQVKQHGNELGFHVDWILTFIEKWDGEEGSETLFPLCEKLAARFGYELMEAAA